MPKLCSGRHVGVTAELLLDRIRYGEDHIIYGTIVAYRLSVHSPAELLRVLPVAYFDESKGEPPNAPAYPSGFTVAQALAGEAGWSAEEIEDFKRWTGEERVQRWLAEQYAEINAAIRASPALDDDVLEDDHGGAVEH